MEDISVTFARKASIHPSSIADEKPQRQSGPNPAALVPPHIVGPVKGRSHNGTLVLLHGFTCNGPDLAEELLPQLRDRLEARQYNGLRFVFLTAPVRQVSCYGDPRPEHTAWHDYWSDHGGSEGRPDLEEEIDQGQLDWSRAQVHQILDAEAQLLGGDHSRVAILGQSQGESLIEGTQDPKPSVATLSWSLGKLARCPPLVGCLTVHINARVPRVRKDRARRCTAR